MLSDDVRKDQNLIPWLINEMRTIALFTRDERERERWGREGGTKKNASHMLSARLLWQNNVTYEVTGRLLRYAFARQAIERLVPTCNASRNEKPQYYF